MIVRVSEALVRPDALVAFMTALDELVADLPGRFPGLLAHEVLVDLEDPHRVQYVSRWRDEDAVVDFAGAAWRTAPVTFPGEDAMLVRPLTLRHFIAAPDIARDQGKLAQ